MSEKRPQHPQEPAEGSDEAVEEAAGAERAGETAKGVEGPRPSRHPEEPAEGGEEDVEAPAPSVLGMAAKPQTISATGPRGPAQGARRGATRRDYGHY